MAKAAEGTYIVLSEGPDRHVFVLDANKGTQMTRGLTLAVRSSRRFCEQRNSRDVARWN